MGEAAALALTTLPGRFAVCRLDPAADLPDWARGGLVSATRTARELSIVCEEAAVPDEVRAERGFRVLEVQGPLDFALVGVLAALTTALADAGVSTFALATFDTDYFLVREGDLPRATRALAAAGHRIV